MKKREKRKSILLNTYLEENSNFKEDFFKYGYDEDDYKFITQTKRGVTFLKAEQIKGYTLPPGEVKGHIFLTRRRLFGNSPINALKTKKGQIINVYDRLEGIPIGYLPVNDGTYIEVDTKDKLYLLIMAVLFIILLPNFLLN